MALKICARCGRQFESNKPDKYCSDECKKYITATCMFCGKPFKTRAIGSSKTCSKECALYLKKRTTLEKYGVENVMDLHEFRVKQRDGVKRAWDNEERREETSKRWKKILSDENLVNQRKQHLKERWDSDPDLRKRRAQAISAAWTEERKQKQRNKMKDVMNDPDKIEQSIKKITSILPEDRSKTSKNNWMNPDIRNKMLTNMQATAATNESREKKRKSTSSKEVQIKRYKTMKANNSFNRSDPEDRIYTLLSVVFEDVKSQYHSDLYPYNCDFYIPAEDLYIELNFTWTHGGCPFDETNEKHVALVEEWKNKNSKYYDTAIYTWTDLDVRKIKAFNDNNLNYKIFYNEQQFYKWIQEYSPIIFPWDDLTKISKKDKTNLYGRNLEVREVDKDECDRFLDMYHFQNTCKGQTIRLGLYKDNELVELMTFGKPRYNKNYQYELLRLCTDSNYIVVGGAEKLFKHFIDMYNPASIISYCDNSKFNGDVYVRLGFSIERTGKPSCHWYNNETGRHITDNLLRQRGFSQLHNDNNYEIASKGQSNVDLMINNGYIPIYDCGQTTYIYINK